jgi:hypothetical protein
MIRNGMRDSAGGLKPAPRVGALYTPTPIAGNVIVGLRPSQTTQSCALSSNLCLWNWF